MLNILLRNRNRYNISKSKYLVFVPKQNCKYKILIKVLLILYDKVIPFKSKLDSKLEKIGGSVS